MVKAHSAEMEADAAKNQGDATLAEAKGILEDLLGESIYRELLNRKCSRQKYRHDACWFRLCIQAFLKGLGTFLLDLLKYNVHRLTSNSHSLKILIVEGFP